MTDDPTAAPRDHGGGLDAAIARYGGARVDWIDLSTGINPEPYAVGEIAAEAWTRLPDRAATDRLLAAARAFWNVPDDAMILAAPGASSLIARLPWIGQGAGKVHIPAPTYNEHAAAFAASDRWTMAGPEADAQVHVHPNNPDGKLWPGAAGGGRLTVIDESFCDVMPAESHIARTAEPGTIVLKSFGKFWGLAGVRLGFAIGHPATLTPAGGLSMADALGPWPVPGPALEVGARALTDIGWAEATRARLARDAARMDEMVMASGAWVVGGTSLFRLYAVADAAAAQEHLARHQVWSRIFPYSSQWLRLGLPPGDRWSQLEGALASAGEALAGRALP